MYPFPTWGVIFAKAWSHSPQDSVPWSREPGCQFRAFTYRFPLSDVGNSKYGSLSTLLEYSRRHTEEPALRYCGQESP
jgi:hypothetical protein